jgi:hypothetical protein
VNASLIFDSVEKNVDDILTKAKGKGKTNVLTSIAESMNSKFQVTVYNYGKLNRQLESDMKKVKTKGGTGTAGTRPDYYSHVQGYLEAKDNKATERKKSQKEKLDAQEKKRQGTIIREAAISGNAAKKAAAYEVGASSGTTVTTSSSTDTTVATATDEDGKLIKKRRVLPADPLTNFTKYLCHSSKHDLLLSYSPSAPSARA